MSYASREFHTQPTHEGV